MGKTLYGATALALLGFTAGAKANVLYFAQPINYDQNEIDTVFLYGAAGTSGTVSSPSGFNSTFSVGANNVTSVVVPSSYDLTTSGTVTNNGSRSLPTAMSAPPISAARRRRRTRPTCSTQPRSGRRITRSAPRTASATRPSYPSSAPKTEPR